MTRVFYKEAMGAVVVFDITNSSTLEAASEWKQDLDSKVCLDSGRPVPAVLLANKCDMTGRDRDLVSSLDSFCKANSFMGWFETSAKVCVVFQLLWEEKICAQWLPGICRHFSQALLAEVRCQIFPFFFVRMTLVNRF